MVLRVLILCMTSSESAIEFKAFMYWFEEMYPEYHSKYAANMKAASDNHGLRVTMEQIDKHIYNILFEIQNEYYLTHM